MDYKNMRQGAKDAKAGNRVPEGNYRCKLIGAAYGRAETGREMIVIEWRILDKCAFRGKSLKMRFFPDVDFSWKAFCLALDILGVNLDNVSSRADVEDAFEELTEQGPNHTVSVKPQKNNPQYSNYYLLSAKDAAKAENQTGVAEPTPSESGEAAVDFTTEPEDEAEVEAEEDEEEAKLLAQLAAKKAAKAKKAPAATKAPVDPFEGDDE